jgi:extracellular factor (EF) 3-hydroxypalmitic acid methyl ester biosynthesis protein
MNYYELKELIVNLPEIKEKNGLVRCNELLSTILQKYSEKRKNLTQEQDDYEIIEFQKLILPFIHQSEFGHYILEQPRGYNGDYVTQEMIWDAQINSNESKLRGYTEIGKILNYLTLIMDNPKANKDRIDRLKTMISENGNRIASIGSGSAIELWDLVNYKKTNSDIFLLDQDEDALHQAKRKIEQNNNSKIVYHKDNILKFILRKEKSILCKRDLIYVFGLCDYFNLKSTKRIIEGLWKYVDEGGILTVSNVHPNNPTKFWMEYGGNWFLDYKTKEEMIALTTDLPDVSEVKIELDEFQVYQYLTIKRK